MFDSLLTNSLDIIRAFAGHVVAYQRGASEVEVTAATGQTTFETTDEQGTVLRIETRDYLIAAADLDFGSGAVLPERGDKIVDESDGSTRTYEVLSLFGAPAWRYSDSVLRKEVRVHTKEITVA